MKKKTTQIFALLLLSFRPGFLLANLLRTNWKETSVYRRHVVSTECVLTVGERVGRKGPGGSTSILSNSEHLYKPRDYLPNIRRLSDNNV